jgi:hypothetical protein
MIGVARCPFQEQCINFDEVIMPGVNGSQTVFCAEYDLAKKNPCGLVFEKRIPIKQEKKDA